MLEIVRDVGTLVLPIVKCGPAEIFERLYPLPTPLTVILYCRAKMTGLASPEVGGVVMEMAMLPGDPVGVVYALKLVVSASNEWQARETALQWGSKPAVVVSEMTAELIEKLRISRGRLVSSVGFGVHSVELEQ